MAKVDKLPQGQGGVVKTSGFKSFDEFFPYYLREHSNVVCRRLHGARPRQRFREKRAAAR